MLHSGAVYQKNKERKEQKHTNIVENVQHGESSALFQPAHQGNSDFTALISAGFFALAAANSDRLM